MERAKPVIFLLLLAVVFAAGWFTAGLYSDSQQLIIERAATAGAEKSRLYTQKMASESARLLEEKLSELKANESHTERVIRTEVVKPVFSTVCATDDYVRLFNAASASAERTLSGKFADKMPGDVTQAGK